MREPGALSVGVLAETLGVAPDRILLREGIDALGDRVVERVTWVAPGGGAACRACAKHGADPGIAREAAALAALWAEPGDPVPRRLAHRALPDGRFLLLTRWLDGRPADFSDRGDISAVFGALGGWMAACTRRVGEAPRRPVPPDLVPAWRALAGAPRDAAWYGSRLSGWARRALEHPRPLGAMGSPAFAALYRRVGESAAAIARCLVAVPRTFDPGDLTPENTLLCPEGAVHFLDFEYASLAPLVQVLQNLDEPWPAAARGEAARLALRTFFEAYTGAGGVPVVWDGFVRAFRCCRLFKRLCELDDLLGCLLASGCAPEDVAHARWYGEDTPDVVGAALDSLQVCGAGPPP